MSTEGSSAPSPAAPAAQTTTEASNTQLNADSKAIELLEGESLEEASDAPKEVIKASNDKVTEVKSDSKSEPSKAEVKKAADKVDAKQSKTDPDKFNIKVDGQVLELTKEEMVKYAQLGKAGQARMEEAARVKQEALQLVKMLRENPEDVLADPYILGSQEKVIELAQKILSKKLEDEQKSPEAKEKEQLQKELEELRRKDKEREEKLKADEYERLVQQQEQQLETQITEAFESSGIPRSPFVLKRLADVMISAAENNKDISPKQALNMVKKEMQNDIREYIEALQEDALEEFISAEKIKKLRQRQLAKAKAEQPIIAKPAEVKDIASAPVEQKKPEKINMRKFLRG